MEGMSEEKCALVAELVRMLDMVRQLEAHMAGTGQQQQQGGGGGAAAGGDQRCRALVWTMRGSIDRAVHMAMSCCADGRRAAGGQLPESPPSGGDGSPRSAGSDQAGDFRGRGNAAGQCKKKKTLPKRRTQVRVSAVQDVTPLDDGLSWRKYGQKDILGAKYPRAYFRCTHRHTQSCHASKQVQRTDGDPLLFDVVYHGSHTCTQGAAVHPAAASAEHSQAQKPQPAAAAEQTTASPAFESAAGPVLPFSLLSNKPAGADHAAGGATSSPFPGGARVTASPATPECLVQELAATTNSPMAMGEMDFMFPLDADFLENPASYF
ncbi:putative WRKY transcription factor 41 [Dichanthelium oligosanthes]|uniref:Putative WRKY transcription factor 41 n=1 Tax=Dichanthelium oligosanthes TaxID=888268 RepID=A0A1E5WHK8_9POAL|nr:putative WRKY transcription factor 41 [Dichanthelium oligosanthes]